MISSANAAQTADGGVGSVSGTLTKMQSTMLTEKQMSTLSLDIDDTLSPDMPDDEEVEYMPTGIPEGHTKDRIRLNTQMTKELRLRDGCKNLLKAIAKTPKNAPRRNELKAQLAHVQKNISKILKKLQKVNWASSRDYDNTAASYGMISLSQKNTTRVDITANLKQFIKSHYHEEPEKFESEICTLQEARNQMRKAQPVREGKEAVLQYHAYLQQAEHRFFQEDKCLDTVFTWFDVFEGHPVAKKSLKLEKASVLYNVAALASQIAQQQDLTTEAGLATAITELESAAGILQYVREDSALKNSIGTDLARSSLSTLSTFMLAQAQECIWYSALLKGKEKDPQWQPCGAEAAAVSEWYASARESFRQPLSSSVPRQWLDIVCQKEAYYRALANWYSGIEDMGEATKMKKVAGIAKVYRASLDLKACAAKWKKQLPTEVGFLEQIDEHIELTNQVLMHISEEIINGIKAKMDQMPVVTGKAVRWGTTNCDDVLKARPEDLFARLGPVYFFNSMCALVERRTHTVTCSEEEGVGFGFSLSGGNPVRVYDVTYGSPASNAGILAGDYIIEIDGVDVRCHVSNQLDELLSQLAVPGKSIEVSVVVNYDMQNFEELINPEMPVSPTATNDALPMPGMWTPTRQSGNFSINGRGPIG